MQKLFYTSSRHHFLPFVLLCCLLTLLTACGEAGSITSSHETATPTAAAQQSTVASFLKGPVTYVALGASDAVGVGSNVPGAQGYVPLIARHLAAGSHMINLGISGIHLHEALTQELPLALSTSPGLITVWLVANDFVAGVSYDTYMQDLNTLLSSLHSQTKARVVMADLPDLTRLPAFSNQTKEQAARMLAGITQWNAEIAQTAQRYDVSVVDLFRDGSELTAHPEYVSADGFHPSPAGYVRLAELFWSTINQNR